MKNFLKLTPVFLLAGLMMLTSLEVVNLDILIIAPLATIYAGIIAYLTEKVELEELIDISVNNVKDMQLVFFILMLAYAMAEVFMSTGVGAAIINISLKVGLSAKTVAFTSFVVSSILSVATGTSWGTFAACVPIFLWLNYIVGGDVLLTFGAIAGGSCFGDNIGLISETTVVSSGIQGVEVIDRIRYQGIWSILCLILAAIVFLVGGFGLGNTLGNVEDAIENIPEDVMVVLQEESPSAVELLQQVVDGVPLYMVIPLILVLALAIKGLPTIACLLIGLVSSLILGIISGTLLSVTEFFDLVYNGFSNAGSWVIVMMMWVGAFGGIMSRIGAFDPLSNFILKRVKTVRQLMLANGLLSILGNAALADEMAQIITIGPIINEMTEENVVGSKEDKYRLRLRNALFSDALGVFGSQLIPWHVYVVYFVDMANKLYPIHEFNAFELIKYNYMAMISVGSILILTITGWDRFIPLFSMPEEPDVRLIGKKELL